MASYYGMDTGYEPNAGHLWFLINIFLYIIYFIGIIWAFKTYPDNPILRFFRKWLRKPWTLYAVALPLMLEASLVNPEYFASYPTPHGHFLGMICFITGFIFVCLKDDFWTAAQRVRGLSLGLAFLLYLQRHGNP